MIHGYLVAAIVCVGAITGSYFKGRSDGGAIVRSEYAQRDLKAAQDYAAKKDALQDAYRAQEARWQEKFVSASRTHQRELANVHTSKLAAIAAVESGALRLRLNDPADCAPGRDSYAEIASAASGRNGDAEGRFLGKADSAFLIAEASRADALVSQLTACQQVLRDERK